MEDGKVGRIWYVGGCFVSAATAGVALDRHLKDNQARRRWEQKLDTEVQLGDKHRQTWSPTMDTELNPSTNARKCNQAKSRSRANGCAGNCCAEVLPREQLLHHKRDGRALGRTDSNTTHKKQGQQQAAHSNRNKKKSTVL